MSVLGRDLGGDKAAVVPPAEVRTYYDRPVIKPPVWKPEVPWYFFFGGLAGASSLLAAAAGVRGDAGLARAARRVAGVGAAVSPVLLVADLGVPGRFANMLRVFRPTSPLNMGSWLLTVYVPSALGAAALGELGR
ncbi:MAG TPA: NrfD/PsrC family molybdoenzyme membrane anchor subunit, partial [Acidimicrobiales bacterium]|nr:NrfD/PsrC family molybdoenzyme membrane anchor subunit [Acidimicrobiales bacterium]